MTMKDSPVTIAVEDVRPGMQVKSADLWWQVTEIVESGKSTGTMMAKGLRLTASGYPTAGAERLVWLPITRFGVKARVGRPEESSVGTGKGLKRVVLNRRYATDNMPYVDGNGARYAVKDTAAYKRMQVLAHAFARGVTV